MKIRFLKLKNWLLLTAMGLFGVTACQSSKSAVKPEEVNGKNASEASEEIGNAVVMYGTPTVKYDTQERSETALMYGVPTMDFVLKGKVKDEKGNPVSGMQVILVNGTVDITPESMQEDNPYVQDYIAEASDLTDGTGNFECHVKDVPREVQRVIIRDVDGDANGKFESQMVEITFTEADQTGERRGWYMGTRTKDVDITVKKVSEK